MYPMSHVSRKCDLVPIPVPLPKLGSTPLFFHDSIEFIPKNIVEWSHQLGHNQQLDYSHKPFII